jgi:hypothetical protein
MSELKFSYNFLQTTSTRAQVTIPGAAIPGDTRDNVKEITINVPTELLSRIFSFEKQPYYGNNSSYGGRLKLDFLPLKEYNNLMLAIS